MKDLVIGLRAAGRDAAGIRDAAIGAEKAGIDVAWSTSGGLQADPLVAFAAAAGSTEKILFGTCIIPTFPRHPLALAQEAIALDNLAPGRLRLGVGPSHKPAVERTYSFDFSRPLEHLREYITILSTLFRDGKVSFHGTRLHAEAELAAPVDVKVMISALRHNAFKLAGELAEGGISWVTPKEHIKTVAAPALAEGAKAAGRDTVPPAIMHLPIVVSTDEQAVFEAAKQQFGFYQRLPFYSAMMVEAGYAEAAGTEFTPALAKGIVISGGEDDVARQVRALPSFGVGEIIADPVLLAGDRAAKDRTIELLGSLAKE
jgi:alkanesulfonate monooxygenase SsuD/methylene tetrahydromethanopterin reductase-like flavin-dependent oxidoreductase (luciferase family)